MLTTYNCTYTFFLYFLYVIWLTDKKASNDPEEVISVETEVPEVSEVGENNDESNVEPKDGRLNAKRRPNGCPFCDSSVYSYCSDKLLHDACCCLDPHGK